MRPQHLFIAGLILFHFLFWQEGIGLNWTFFTLFAVLSVRPMKLPNQREWLYLLPFIAANTGLLFFHTLFSIAAVFLTFVTYLGFIANQQYSVFENFANSSLSFLFQIRSTRESRAALPQTQRRWARVFTIAIVPVSLFALFYTLFLAGNPIFKDYSDRGFTQVASVFDGVNGFWVLFMLLGVVLVNWALLSRRTPFVRIHSKRRLERIRKSRRPFFGTLDLKREYQAAVILFTLLNILFLVVNFIDVKWVWFQFYVQENFNLKEFVHEGVGWLIFTTLLSAGILLFYFRRNLNFYPGNNRLKQLATLWVIQNLILSISVAIRTFHYIHFHGLAPLRIGVLLFVSLIIVCFIFVGLKINNANTTGWVTKWVSGYAMTLLGFGALVPWNHWIAEHNLAHEIRNEVDVDYYLELGPELYPTLYANLDRIGEQIEAHQSNDTRWVQYSSVEEFKNHLDHLSDRYIQEYESVSFMSWNLAGQRAYSELKKM